MVAVGLFFVGAMIVAVCLAMYKRPIVTRLTPIEERHYDLTHYDPGTGRYLIERLKEEDKNGSIKSVPQEIAQR